MDKTSMENLSPDFIAEAGAALRNEGHRLSDEAFKALRDVVNSASASGLTAVTIQERTSRHTNDVQQFVLDVYNFCIHMNVQPFSIISGILNAVGYIHANLFLSGFNAPISEALRNTADMIDAGAFKENLPDESELN